MDFDGFDETCGIDGRAEDKIPVDVAAAGGNGEGRSGVQNQVGLAKLPAGTEFRHGREIGGGGPRGSRVDPSFRKRKFLVWKGGGLFPILGIWGAEAKA